MITKSTTPNSEAFDNAIRTFTEPYRGLVSNEPRTDKEAEEAMRKIDPAAHELQTNLQQSEMFKRLVFSLAGTAMQALKDRGPVGFLSTLGAGLGVALEIGYRLGRTAPETFETDTSKQEISKLASFASTTGAA